MVLAVAAAAANTFFAPVLGYQACADPISFSGSLLPEGEGLGMRVSILDLLRVSRRL
jgi:hypothetical protein